ncbi:uncharacterized protein CC84DRAFT_435229 [Paraphaeosphaeria sporulosa]|uniref:Uncharacterized protein n=1 Tax=Paraphaeosphaeria sporulosa TaxID=1460663 RepID=A0A177CPB6_9PLEO|nr:uncharacterized protein CC84DRAFT_435229 [Paraphaeosphaeria sporulosa]OAG09365.1 hypothetical protein CC84DRAFT_435229 [Paraphaeosphaeria sporulosa]
MRCAPTFLFSMSSTVDVPRPATGQHVKPNCPLEGTPLRQPSLPPPAPRISSTVSRSHPHNPLLPLRHNQRSSPFPQPPPNVVLPQRPTLLSNLLPHRSRKVEYTPQQPRPPPRPVHPRLRPHIHPHPRHDATPHEVEDGHHEQEDVREAPLVRLAGLARAARVDEVRGIVRGLAGGGGAGGEGVVGLLKTKVLLVLRWTVRVRRESGGRMVDSKAGRPGKTSR